MQLKDSLNGYKTRLQINGTVERMGNGADNSNTFSTKTHSQGTVFISYLMANNLWMEMFWQLLLREMLEHQRESIRSSPLDVGKPGMAKRGNPFCDRNQTMGREALASMN
jgi:LEA14-like dessication related protein